MHTTRTCAVALLLTAAALAPAAAQNAKLGRQKAQPCMVCHGQNGLSTQPDAPSLAGQPAFYLTAQLQAYRSGDRRHETMAMMAKTLSDEDMANVSARFASIKVEAHVPK